ncbi:hypothetical protein H2198_010693 [Neophaeococcomyces mojaviensis]|uniref:Uncharacterized protein n=1 Tax=Neophaeococcomyces mojaviensis TaxID=3383035 RepID=A0ACC2ZQZ3_9EURO|nr:hypothetical protein H2198_010693 [Knufia sp. JES_112]
MSTYLNLEKQLRFYGAYHHNPSQGTNTGPLVRLPEWATIPHLELNLGTIVCLVYCALYILLEPVAGTGLSILLLLGTAGGDYLVGKYGNEANKWAIGAHVFSWIAQFIGHGKFEGRAPALLDNLFQAFFLAPLFVWLETLFALGYRPELQARVDKLVQQDVAKFREEREKKKLANGSTNGTAKTNGHTKSS